MIEAKDVRIGNIVAAGVQIVTIAGIYTREIEKDLPYKEHFYVSGFVGDYYCFNPNDLEPILLTEEALPKMGFEAIKSNVPGLMKQAPFDGQRQFRWDKIDGMALQTVGSGFKFLLPHIKSVHSFQNAYHAITGKQLTIINL